MLRSLLLRATCYKCVHVYSTRVYMLQQSKFCTVHCCTGTALLSLLILSHFKLPNNPVLSHLNFNESVKLLNFNLVIIRHQHNCLLPFLFVLHCLLYFELYLKHTFQHGSNTFPHLAMSF